MKGRLSKALLARSRRSFIVRCRVAHVLLLFNHMGLIGPSAIPPNDQLRRPERRAFPRIVGVSKRQNKQHFSVCLILETDPPDWQAGARGGGAEATETLSNRVLGAFCISSTNALLLSVSLHVSLDIVHCIGRWRERGQGDKRQA